MDFILNKLKNLHISGASVNAPSGAGQASHSVVVGSGGGLQKNKNEKCDIEQTASQERKKSDVKLMTTDQNKSVSLNDILGGPKIERVLVENECGDNINKNADQKMVTRVENLDRGDQILNENNILQPAQLHKPTIVNDQHVMETVVNLNVNLEAPNSAGLQIEQLKVVVNPPSSSILTTTQQHIQEGVNVSEAISSMASLEVQAPPQTAPLICSEIMQQPICAELPVVAIPKELPKIEANVINESEVRHSQAIIDEISQVVATTHMSPSVKPIVENPSQTLPLNVTDLGDQPIYSDLPLLTNPNEIFLNTPPGQITIHQNTPEPINIQTPQISEQKSNETQKYDANTVIQSIAQPILSSTKVLPNSSISQPENKQLGLATNIVTPSPEYSATVKCDVPILPSEAIEHDSVHGVDEILTDLVNAVSPTKAITQPIVMEITSDCSIEPQIKSELAVVCPETNVGMSNKIETVKKNLLTMFDTLDSIQPNEAENKLNVKKLGLFIPPSLPAQSVNDGINPTPQAVLNEIKDEVTIQLAPETSIVTQNISASQPVLLEFQELNSEIKSNNEKISSTLESVILNQVLDQEYATESNYNNELVRNGNALENLIVHQILEQNGCLVPTDDVQNTKCIEKQQNTDFQIADIDVTSADNFIEFVDEIIDFALRKVDFLKIANNTETTQPLTPVPEEVDEASEAVKLNDYYDCLYTPTVEPHNINFPTLESFEIEELQAKVMEQQDALYLNETPIDGNIPLLSGVAESPKINELQAKAKEQAQELNLNENAAGFTYLHSADKSKPHSESVDINVKVETHRKVSPPIAIAAVIDNLTTQSFQSTNGQSNNLPEPLDNPKNEPFFLGEPPSMYRSQSNGSQSPMETSQTKLSQSMNEVYFDKRLDITGKRSFRRERDQKVIQKSRKDHFNENLNREKSREKSQEPLPSLNKDTPRDSLEDLSQIKTDSLATEDNKQEQNIVSDPLIEKQENEKPESEKDNTDNKTNRKESLKDSLENIVDAIEQEENSDNTTKPQDAEVDKSMRDSLENLVEAVEAISESVKQDEVAIEMGNQTSVPLVEEISNKDKQCNCSVKKTNDITSVIDKVQQQKGVECDVKENVIHHNKTTAPTNNSVVQLIEENVTSPVVLSTDLTNRKEPPKDVTMSLDIMNGGGDKLDSNKYYESVNDEPKIKTDFIMAEYRKPVGSSNGDLDKIINEYESKEESLIRRLTDKEKIITKMTGVMEAYEKTIAEMIAEKEQLIQEYEKKCVNLKSDADLNAQHLLSLEDTFADLHAKYERSKQITLDLKTNEEGLRRDNQKNLELLNAQEIRYEKMKSHAIGQLQIANEKLEILQRAHAQETTKLKALLKREELARSSLTEQLQQKIRENEELVKICEELIGKE